MQFLLRLLIIFFVISSVLSLIRGLFTPSRPQQRRPPPEPEYPPEPTRHVTSGHLVKDPVCGTYIPETTALRAANLFFCSEECRGKYLAAH